MDIIRLDLLTAVRIKGIQFKAWAKNSFSETLLLLKNEDYDEFQIDVSRTGLTARTGESQTIGLCHPMASIPGDHILILKSGQEMEVVFSSRCLDRGGNPPDDGMEYVLVPKLLADYVAKLLQQGTDQREVWNAIEKQRGEIIRRAEIPAMVDKF